MDKATPTAGLGPRLQRLRELAELSHNGLAGAAGLGKAGGRTGPTIGQWERGEAKPRLEMLVPVVEVLADRLGRSRGDLLAYIVWG